jgi:hypothetical protein
MRPSAFAHASGLLSTSCSYSQHDSLASGVSIPHSPITLSPIKHVCRSKRRRGNHHTHSLASVSVQYRYAKGNCPLCKQSCGLLLLHSVCFARASLYRAHAQAQTHTDTPGRIGWGCLLKCPCRAPDCTIALGATATPLPAHTETKD